MEEHRKKHEVNELLVKSVSALWGTVAKAEAMLRKTATKLGVGEEIPVWYRGHSSPQFRLLPTLSRFQISPETEQQIHSDYAAFRRGERGWRTLFHLQHYGAPTRLLDWTTDLATALYFAFESGVGNNPVLWILHPGILNKKGDFDPKPTLPEALQPRLQYPEHCNTSDWPRLPFAIMPPISDPRIQAQHGMFTVQGLDDFSLEDQCAEALARIAFELPDADRDLLRRLGPKSFAVFPDEVGMALSLNHEYRLPERAIESTVGAAWKKKGIVPGTASCVTDEMYVPRDRDKAQFKEWLGSHKEPILLLTGRATAGKTNFLVKVATDCGVYEPEAEHRPARPILLFSLGHYLQGTRTLSSRLADFLRESHADGHSRAIDERVLENLIRGGQIVLALDGLDELVRNRGEECVLGLVEELRALVYDRCDRAKIVVACRDHIAHRLKQRKVLKSLRNPRTLRLRKLSWEIMRDNLQRQHREADFSRVKDKLLEVPLLYGVLVRSHEQLTGRLEPSNLWEVWLGIASRAAGLEQGQADLMSGLRKIASRMLKLRDDYLSDAQIPEGCRGLVDTLTRSGTSDSPVFVREQDGRWRFIHQAVREYVVASDIYHGLQNSKEETVLTSITDLDYESAEAYKHLYDMLGNTTLRSMTDELRLDKAPDERGDNYFRNYFEAQGMLGVKSEEERSAAIDRALTVLQSPGLFSHRVRYNAARCLTRLHPSSPAVYCIWAARSSWPELKSGRLKAIYGYAVRGFHRRSLGLDDGPPETFVENQSEPNLKICEALIQVLREAALDPYNEGAQFVQVNCSHALIRWFHPRAESQLLEVIHSRAYMPQTRMNLFLALSANGKHLRGFKDVLLKQKHANQLRGDLKRFVELLDGHSRAG